MKQINHDDLIKLNERLDSMLSSDKVLEAAAQSKSPVFRAAAELTKAEHPQLSAEMRERMRAKVLKAVPTVQKPTKQAIFRPTFLSTVAKIAAVLVLIIFVGVATPPALANSLPGDFLYPAKRGLETVELVFAGDALGQVTVHLNQSERRLDESERLLAKGRFESSVMDDALISLESAIRIANDNNLFESYATLELRSSGILTDFVETLDTAEAANLVDDAELARLESGEELVMAHLPSQMAEPSSSSEVTSRVEASPTAETAVTAVETEASPEATEAVIVYMEETTVYVNAEGNVNVRDGAGTAYNVIARVIPNSAVTAIGVAGDWTQVRLEDGRVGWIANFLLSQTPPVVEAEATETVDTGTPVDTGAGTTGSTSSTSSSTNPPPTPCPRGRSCEAPGHGNGGGNNGGGSGN